ncbi:hypothetical protein [Rubricoccus marinus]|uniref:Uncharacterized protein n=1 Tax=Rubricoccus marinus TaxID=716817 RepID=A0A259U2S6_9BACT|nr:hypothetical protein [Rubricoccus marinus]OZC04246.1 hypothetical protein BSZ36_15405 [Rubricoccus marinus]
MTTATQSQPHAFALLLGQYISGDVNEEQITSFCDLVETTSASAAERLAFASYYLDAKTEAAKALPRAEEWAEIANTARA